MGSKRPESGQWVHAQGVRRKIYTMTDAYRVRGHSYYVNILLFTEIITNAKGYIWDDIHDDWDSVSGYLEIDYAAEADSSCRITGTVDGTDTKITKHWSAGPFSVPTYDFIEGDTYLEYVANVYTCRFASWSSPC